jgi:hypothetical protein
MALIHNTTMNPGKLELLTAWLAAQPWYLHPEYEPVLSKAGGFRLDDPRGEVGIEFMVVTDRSGNTDAAYHVPLTYRGAALAGAEAGLIGTAEHGVLGRRWIYDGVYDPVLLTQLVALIQGDAEPQAQSVSNTADPTVTTQPVTQGSLTPARSAIVANRAIRHPAADRDPRRRGASRRTPAADPPNPSAGRQRRSQRRGPAMSLRLVALVRSAYPQRPRHGPLFATVRRLAEPMTGEPPWIS